MKKRGKILHRKKLLLKSLRKSESLNAQALFRQDLHQSSMK